MTQPSSAIMPDNEREFHFDAEEFRQIAAVLYADSGIFLAEQKQPLVYGRLVKRLRAVGLESFKDYCALIQSSNGTDERKEMLSALTTNVTQFFRERHHFDYLKSNELPKLVKRAREGGRVRIWSAGCSKGHEPFSIAMTVLEAMPDALDHDIKILASDIDPSVLAIGRAGKYDAQELADVPESMRKRFFKDEARHGSTANDALRELISFRELNLIGNWPMKHKFQVIFCRNVTIYFDDPTKSKIWDRFVSVLEPGGLLCIGHSERIAGPASSKLSPTGVTMYRRSGEPLR